MSEIYTHRNPPANRPTKDGPLSGRKVVIQPNMSVRGWRTDAGSRALEGFIGLEDATAVIRLREAGAALVGSCRMSELGFGLAGDTATRFLAGGEADVALVTDTLGEARMAAAESGAFGFKPTYGIVSRFGLIGLVPSLESYGLLGKRLEDIVAVLSVMAGKDREDPSLTDEGFPAIPGILRPGKVSATVGVVKECFGFLEEKERQAFRAGLARLEEAGLPVREVSLADFDLFRAVHQVIAAVEASSSAGKYDGVRYGHRSSSGKNWNEMYLNSRKESFGTLLKAFLFQGAYFQFENYPAFENACRIRRRLVRTTADLLRNGDLLALPTRRPAEDARRASAINRLYDAFAMTVPANVTGQPSLHIPGLSLDAGADIGLQLIGSRGEDSRILSVGLKLSSSARGVGEHEV